MGARTTWRVDRWLVGRNSGDPRTYVIGFLAVVLASAANLVLEPLVAANSAFPLLLGAVTTAAWLGGLGPGLATTLLGALASVPRLAPAGLSLGAPGPGEILGISVFLLEGAFISVIVAQLRADRDRARHGNKPEGPQIEGQALRNQIAVLDRMGSTLAGYLDLERLAKAIADAGVIITGAELGVFRYRDPSGAWSHATSGTTPATLVDLPLFQDAEAPGPPALGVSRSDDLSSDPRYRGNPPFGPPPAGSQPTRSYVAAPVRSGTGALLGGLYFGHPDPGVFHESHEHLITGLAVHAAIAVENAHLYRDAKEARAAAETASRVKDEFLATLSHELRTPLSAILGWAYLLQQGKLPEDEVSVAVETIIRNATAQEQIIDELLDVSRIVTGKLQLGFEPVELGSVVKAAIGTVTPAANAKDIRLQLIHDPAGSWVMGDPERLQQVFWNLLSNAVKFTPKKGRVRVSVQSVESRVEVAVADTGVGIDAAFLPHVFARFSQRDSSSTRAVRGLGLGLAIAKQLVELHGGSVQAESIGAGQGSTFTVKFPRSPVTATPSNGPVYSQADRSVRSEEAPDLRGIRVLIVEDNDDARVLVAKVLESHGAVVTTSSSTHDALEILERERIDVLLSDIEMPGTDGYELIRELRRRSSQQGGNIPAAALTAYARTEDRLRALRAGFQMHLSKPVQPAELITVVASLATRPR